MLLKSLASKRSNLMKKLLSFVIPCYRSENTIEKVIQEIRETVARRQETYDYEVICVNDSSPDNVLSVLKKLAEKDTRVKVVDFSKNRGKHAAVLAGMSFAKGDYIVNLDDDCQCPVYELWRLLEPLEKDECDFSTANYKQKKQSLWKNFGSNVNRFMSCILLNKPKGLRLENFSAMKRFVMEEMIRYNKPYPYLEGLILRVTNRISVVMMEERDRGDDNTTGFTLKKSLSLWLNGFTAFSVKPLRISTVLGLCFAVIGFIAGIVIVIKKLVDPDVMLGWTSIMALTLFTNGVIMVILGLIGEYVGRIYICLNNTPQYVIRDTINIDKKEEMK